MSALTEAKCILATDPPILLSTPEWRALVQRLVDEQEADRRQHVKELREAAREAASEQRWSDRADAEGVARGSY